MDWNLSFVSESGISETSRITAVYHFALGLLGPLRFVTVLNVVAVISSYSAEIQLCQASAGASLSEALHWLLLLSNKVQTPAVGHEGALPASPAPLRTTLPFNPAFSINFHSLHPAFPPAVLGPCIYICFILFSSSSSDVSFIVTPLGQPCLSCSWWPCCFSLWSWLVTSRSSDTLPALLARSFRPPSFT